MTTHSFLTDRGIGSAAANFAAVGARHATDGELHRRIEPAVARELVASGFPRHFVPGRWGGTEGGFREYVDAVSLAASGDPSAAWCASVAASLGRMCAYLPPDGQAEIWADGPDAWIVGALMPSGSATADGDGWLLSGEWPYMSGVDHADWALVCCVVPADSPAAKSEVRFFVVPAGSYESDETWFTTGMRATGSNTVTLRDVHVPRSRSFTRDELSAGRAPQAASACHLTPLKAVTGLSFAAPLLGAVRGALDLWVDGVAAKLGASTEHRMAAASGAELRLVLADVSSRIDAAELLLSRAADTADSATTEGGLPPDLVARGQRDTAVASSMLVDAVNTLFRTAGTRAQSETSAFQRLWRDANCAAGHAALQFEPAAMAYSALILGDRAARGRTASTFTDSTGEQR